MKKFCVLCGLILTGVLGLVGLASAENEALYDASTGQLNIPKVVVGPNTYEVDMQLKAGEGLMTFTLSGATLNTNSINDSIVGSWASDDSFSAVVITFFANFNFMLAHGYSDDPTGQPGMETGTYVWDSNTGAFIASMVTDTNGEWGLSHPKGPVTVSINGDILTMNIVNEGSFTFNKVR